MKEAGAAIIFLALAVLATLFVYFGMDDKDPACLVLGVAIFGALMVIVGS